MVEYEKSDGDKGLVMRLINGENKITRVYSEN